jgi:cobalt-zinc-cadmium efflux system membrane fusion protein
MRNAQIIIASILFLFPIHAWSGEGHEDDHGHEHSACTPADAECSADAHGDEDHHEHGEEAGVIVLSEGVLRDQGITLEKAGSAEIARVLKVYGRVSPNQNRLAHIHPRFPGIVKEARKTVGDVVERNETLAVIESNQSLQPYQVVSLLSGTVLYRHATIGEYVTEGDPIFIVADLSTLWVDLFIFPSDFSLIKEGLSVKVRVPHSTERLVSTISFVSRVADERTQARVARAVLEGKEGSLLPDQYVEAEVVLESVSVPLAVSATAVQTVGGRTLVFVKNHEGFEPREVLTGRSDGEWTEILSGLTPGAGYAAGNTFLFKAELGKESAEHEH